jgi:NADH dehydrogenase FAD-containing subunit
MAHGLPRAAPSDQSELAVNAVAPDLSVPGQPNVFVVGDTAHLEQDGKPLPGVAQVALQQGRYAGSLIAGRVEGRSAPRAFRYFGRWVVLPKWAWTYLTKQLGSRIIDPAPPNAGSEGTA